MPRLTIDGQGIEMPAGATVMEAAEALGILVPHYCYHAALGIAGNCRMCLVEIERLPKLVTACTQPVMDDMVVYTKSEKVLEAQRDVQEFLLKNHPLDCPVCDQAGECLLQDFYMKYAQHDSRLLESKNRKTKAKSIGPRIILDQERCIVCTRCVRFLRDVTKPGELGVFGRGSREALDIFPGVELDNDYDGNVVDLCPVGALTDKSFRFRVRSWYLDHRVSVCDGCSTGCNVFVDINIQKTYKNEGKRIVRFRPRPTPEINGHWICNHGRYSFRKHEEERLLVPRIRSGAGWPDDVDRALKTLTTTLREEVEGSGGNTIGVIVAPSVSNEEALLIRKIFAESIGTPNIDHRIPGLSCESGDDQEPVDGLLRRRDPWPNSRGLAEIGLVPRDGGLDTEGMIEAAAAGSLTTLVIIGVDLTESGLSAETVRKAWEASTVVAFVSHRSEMTSHVTAALPIATHLERDGTFANYKGAVQRFRKVVDPIGETRPLLPILSQLGRLLDVDGVELSAESLFEEMATTLPLFDGLTLDRLDEQDAALPEPVEWLDTWVVPQL